MESSKHQSIEAPTPSGVYFSEAQQAVPAPLLAAEVEMPEQIRSGGWEVGFCGCCTHCVPNCCMATFCPCISLAQISGRLGILSFGITLVIYLVIELALTCFQSLALYEFRNSYYSSGWGYGGYYSSSYHYSHTYGDSYYHSRSVYFTSSANVYSGTSGALNLLVFVFVWHLRTKTRERFNIPGSCCCDCCASFCCSCCTMAQIATHIKSYKPGNCDFGPCDTLPAYAESYVPAPSAA